MISVSIKSYGSNISQFFNAVENSIDWCVNIKSHLFDHIPNPVKHMRGDFLVGIKEMIEDDAGGLLGGVGIEIYQGSDLLRIYIYDHLLL